MKGTKDHVLRLNRCISAIAMRPGKGLATLPSSGHVPFETWADLVRECDIKKRQNKGRGRPLELMSTSECEYGRIESGGHNFRGSTLELRVEERISPLFQLEGVYLALASSKEDSTSSVVKGRPIGRGKAPQTYGRRNKTLSQGVDSSQLLDQKKHQTA
ncbi:hypothetical protein C8R45DRAFT_922454 [Mycena sanguinolenta]|nr:hypothetical protein C8R45DRAFT_922454 [Mycena sanguinolenta]